MAFNAVVLVGERVERKMMKESQIARAYKVIIW